MTALLVPQHPRFTTDSERDVCQRLVRGLPDGSVVLANVRVTVDADDLEADLVALVPDSGVVVVEVKGGNVWHTEDGWRQATREGDKPIDPFDQAMRVKRGLIKYVAHDPRWSQGRVRWSHHVVFPGTDLSPDFATPQAPRWQVSGRGDLPRVVDQILDNLELHASDDAGPPSHDTVRLLQEILAGRFLPERLVSAQAEANEAHTQRLTEEQATLLAVTKLIPRIEVRGGAGSGKTHLAMQHALRLADGRLTGTPQRVAVVCYSYGLANHLRRQLLGKGSRKKQPRFVGSFEDLANLWGIDTTGADRNNHHFWDVELPAMMAEKAAELPPEKRFDALIVDEAQDMADHWWRPLLLCLADEATSRIGVYSDERQRVFKRFGDPPVQLVPLVLDHNLRNTRQIHQVFAPLAPIGMQSRGGSGPEVRFVECDPDEALGLADDEVEHLLDQGWEPQDVALLTVGERHPEQSSRQASLGFREYWDTFWDGSDVFYGHVLGFKGMERRAVVLCLNGRTGRGPERLYVGLSRATDLLVVVGAAESIIDMGGTEVLRTLRESQ